MPGVLRPSGAASTVCEWKGTATYWDVVTTDGAASAAMLSTDVVLPEPHTRFRRPGGCVSGYPTRLVCTVDGQRVRPQVGRFYGGWITSDVVGSFKGGPGTWAW